MAETSELTCRHLEEKLSQSILVTYLTQLGHQPSQVDCKLIEQMLTILVHDSITKPEQLLVKHGSQQLAKQVHLNIQKALQPHLKLLIEEVLAVPVTDILSDSKSNTGTTSFIAILGRASVK